MTVLAVIFVILSFIFLLLVEPRKCDKERYSKFAGRSYAHRGLYAQDQSIPENSLAAFTAARDGGFGIELDVHLLSDGHLAVVHDANLSRVCGIDRNICELSSDDLKSCRLFGTEETIPLFSDVLSLIDGKVPLIIEIKTDSGNHNEVCAELWNELRFYRGLFCVESFDPRAVAWFNRHQPNIYRGQLVRPYAVLKKTSPKLAAFIVSNVLSNIISRPHFIAHDGGKKSFPVRVCEALGARKITWTVSDNARLSACELNNDCLIFEHCDARPRYYKEL